MGSGNISTQCPHTKRRTQKPHRMSFTYPMPPGTDHRCTDWVPDSHRPFFDTVSIFGTWIAISIPAMPISHVSVSVQTCRARLRATSLSGPLVYGPPPHCWHGEGAPHFLRLFDHSYSSLNYLVWKTWWNVSGSDEILVFRITGRGSCSPLPLLQVPQ